MSFIAGETIAVVGRYHTDQLLNLSWSCTSLVSLRRPLPREKGSGDISIANLFCWNADMSLWAQKLRSSRGNCNDVRSIYSTHAQLLCCIFLTAAVLCIACGADIGPKFRVNFLVLVKKEHWH